MKYIGPKELLENLDRVISEVGEGEVFVLIYQGRELATFGDGGYPPSEPVENGTSANAAFAAMYSADPATAESYADSVEAALALRKEAV